VQQVSAKDLTTAAGEANDDPRSPRSTELIAGSWTAHELIPSEFSPDQHRLTMQEYESQSHESQSHNLPRTAVPDIASQIMHSSSMPEIPSSHRNRSALRRCQTVPTVDREGVRRVVLVDFDGPVNDFALYSPDRCPELATKSVTGEICAAAF